MNISKYKRETHIIHVNKCRYILLFPQHAARSVSLLLGIHVSAAYRRLNLLKHTIRFKGYLLLLWNMLYPQTTLIWALRGKKEIFTVQPWKRDSRVYQFCYRHLSFWLIFYTCAGILFLSKVYNYCYCHLKNECYGNPFWYLNHLAFFVEQTWSSL